jgi:hypothetical protein
MGKVGAQITMSLDGYVAVPNDGPGRGLGPVVLGSGERLFEGLDKDVELEQVGVVQSGWVTHLRFRVLPA